MKPKIYIAGPMTGLPNHNYHAFHRADAALRIAGYKTLSPTIIGEKFGMTLAYEFYLAEGLRLLLDCNAVCVLDGWGRSRGAVLEVTVAQACGMPVATLEEWQERKRREVPVHD